MDNHWNKAYCYISTLSMWHNTWNTSKQLGDIFTYPSTFLLFLYHLLRWWGSRWWLNRRLPHNRLVAVEACRWIRQVQMSTGVTCPSHVGGLDWGRRGWWRRWWRSLLSCRLLSVTGVLLWVVPLRVAGHIIGIEVPLVSSVVRRHMERKKISKVSRLEDGMEAASLLLWQPWGHACLAERENANQCGGCLG